MQTDKWNNSKTRVDITVLNGAVGGIFIKPKKEETVNSANYTPITGLPTS